MSDDSATAHYRQSVPSDHDGLAACLQDEVLQLQLLGSLVRADERDRYVIAMTHRQGWVEHRVAGFVATVGVDERVIAGARVDGESISFFVAQAQRRQGIGSALIRHAMTSLSAWGAARLTAYVAPTNTPSQRLLVRAGFREVERAAFITAPGGVPQTLIVYAAGLKGTL